MNRLMFAAIAAAALSAPALAQEVDAALRQAAIDKCVASGDASAPETSTMCVCLVDGLIAKIPGEDGARLLRLIIADPKSADDAGVALGIPAAEAEAFVESHNRAVTEVAHSCMPQPEQTGPSGE